MVEGKVYFDERLEFAVLSVHDLQLQADDARVNKKEVMAYVFLGDQCLDTLVLGSALGQCLN